MRRTIRTVVRIPHTIASHTKGDMSHLGTTREPLPKSLPAVEPFALRHQGQAPAADYSATYPRAHFSLPPYNRSQSKPPASLPDGRSYSPARRSLRPGSPLRPLRLSTHLISTGTASVWSGRS